MTLKVLVTFLFIVLLFNPSFAQKIEYPHCDCTELKEELEYNLVCEGVFIERIPMKNGMVNGQWISRNINSDTILIANYKNGILDGEFVQFHENGRMKLKAEFKNGRPQSDWVFYNDKGRIIKKGSYNNGKPVGRWLVFNKKGRKELLAYDFDVKQYTLNNFNPYYSSKAVLQDDLNNEFVIAYFPDLSVRQAVQPLGGFISATEYMSDYMNIPIQFFNTYFGFSFTAKVIVEEGRFELKDLKYDENISATDGFNPVLPFFVETNDRRKLNRIRHSVNSLWLLQKRIEQLLAITGPWVMAGNEQVDFDIQIPIQINTLRKY